MEQVPLFSLDKTTARFCRPPDFARANDIPVQTLYSATSSGRIVHVRVNGRLYLDVESAEKYMITYRKYSTEEK